MRCTALGCLRSLTAFGVMFAAGSLHADVFWSGRLGMNMGPVAGTVSVASSNRTGLQDGGASYNNVFGTGAGGASQAGDTIRAVGVTILSGGQTGTSTQSFAANQNQIVAIYALQGKIVNPGPAGAKATFKIEDGGTGVGVIIDRSSISAGTAFDKANVATWAPNVNNLAANTIATLNIAPVPQAILSGDPGPTVTEDPVVFGLANLNTAAIDISPTLPSAIAQFKFDIASTEVPNPNYDPMLPESQDNPLTILVPVGSFYNNPNPTEVRSDVPPTHSPLNDPWVGYNILEDLATLINFNQQLANGQTTNPIDGTDVTNLNSIFNQLIGGTWATGVSVGSVVGSDYNPFSILNQTNSGDVVENNTGGFGIPGGQFSSPPPQVTPEPTTLLSWVVLAVGVGLVARHRRRNGSV